jgi:type I restriction enzyme R subunit
MSRDFNEATRVQMPALVHLTRLGYSYAGKLLEKDAGTIYEPDTNILLDVFNRQFAKLNPEHADEFDAVLREIRQELDNDDLGRSFYERLVSVSPLRLIDFDNPENNDFQFTAEFTCKNGQDNFRPDITLFVNGLPLAFIEVKRPHNTGGMIAESERMNRSRFPNRKFRRFINLTQLMIFSNNMEYDAQGGITPIQGVFYCAAARDKTNFSTFREENPLNKTIAPFNEYYPYREIDPDLEKQILSDFNAQVIRSTSEYQVNRGEYTPTNRVLTSMCSPERLLFLIKYGTAYVRIDKEVDGKIESVDQKHIMRYQQMFAALAVREKLNEGITSGVIWHTQGSGKTALSYHLNGFLTDYYAAQNKVAKFYFIVDRLDLLEQASQEFEARGLSVKTASSREELMEQFRTNQSLEGNTGQREVTVVNIQRFAEDKTRVDLSGYATNLQRIFIVDEAHRGYNPVGSFLANLFEADPNAIKIALTGTPLLQAESASWKVFGDYLHTYYYDKSIQDGYTLKIIREDVETTYRERLSEIYDSIENLVRKKDVPKNEIVEHEKYVKEVLRYIINDFISFRIIQGDESLGAMVICETSEQARKLYAHFDAAQADHNLNASSPSSLKAGLILHDFEDKDTRKQTVTNFKKNQSVDILIVFNMLLTGFDAPRLKRVYLGRRLKDHNLLQALTRVNRPYSQLRYGYVVDFADIKENFEDTNRAYLHELSRFNNTDETEKDPDKDVFATIIEDPAQLIERVETARQHLFNFDLDNAEVFSSQIAMIEEKTELLELRKSLISVRETFNIARTFGDDELKAQIESLKIDRLAELISEVERAIMIFNQKEAFSDGDEASRMINAAMQEIEFNFRIKDSEEMRLATGAQQELKSKWQHTIQAFTENIDQEDPKYITLKEAFMQRFKERGFTIDSFQDFDEESRALDEVYKKLLEIHRYNAALSAKYRGDLKFVRIHKRVQEENEQRKVKGDEPIVAAYDEKILHFLEVIKTSIDEQVYDRSDILKKDAYFEQTVMEQISKELTELGFTSDRSDRQFMQHQISRQYLDQYNSTYLSISPKGQL